MSTEQVETNTPEELSYDELYNKGFEEKSIEVEEEESESTEEEETLEQPEDTDEAETEVEIDESEQETEEEESEDSNEQSSEEELFAITYKGQEIKVNKEELIALGQKGFDYTSKTQDLANKRKLIEMADEYGIDEETLATLGESKKGNKEAFATLANKLGIDPYELDTEANFKPEIKETNYELDDAINAIKADAENSPVIDNWINMLPSNVGKVFAEKPKALAGLHQDTKNGLSQKIMPDVIKTLALNPDADFIQTYQEVGSRVIQRKEEKPEAKRETKKKMTVSKKKVSKHTNDAKDIWDDDELYEKMQKMRRGF